MEEACFLHTLTSLCWVSGGYVCKINSMVSVMPHWSTPTIVGWKTISGTLYGRVLISMDNRVSFPDYWRESGNKTRICR